MLTNEHFPLEVLDVCQSLNKSGFKAFIVGGSIRDILLGKLKPNDWDVATNAKPPKVIEIFEKKFRVIPTGIKHGTVTILVNHLSIEITTFRVEGNYTDGRRPSEVHFVGDISDDLSRRDLTINAIAYDPINGKLFDPFFGVNDIQKQTIRMVGDPNDRLQEDGLRLIRIFRFVAQLGFNIDIKTLDAVPNHFDVFVKVAKERIHTEFQKLLNGSYFKKAIMLLEETGLLNQIIPEFKNEVFYQNIPGLGINRKALTLKMISNLPEESSLRLRFAVLVHQLSTISTNTKERFPQYQREFIEKFLKWMKCTNKQIANVTHILSIYKFNLPYSMEENEKEKDYSIRKFQYTVKSEFLKEYLMFYHSKEQVLQNKRKLTHDLFMDILQRAKAQKPIELKDLVINGDEVIQYFQLNKNYPSQREFIGLCLKIVRERVEFNPKINQRAYIFNILEDLNKIVSLCSSLISRRVHIVSTDHIRKLYRAGSPEYENWESRHTYLLAKWLILCLLRRSKTSIVIFDGTNLNTPKYSTNREKIYEKFKKYHPIFINAIATNNEININLEARRDEEPSIKKSDADLTIFRRFQKLLQQFPGALSTPKDSELIQLSSRHPEFNSKIHELIDRINQKNNRLIVMSGNVLSGKTYIANVLQKYLEGKNISN